MRTKGSIGKNNCWSLNVSVNGNEIHNQEYKTLQEISSILGFTYNQVVEISNKRKKIGKGTFDTQYSISRIGKKTGCIVEEVSEDAPVLSLKIA
tara:strand:- start:210 stop:491 length:282 start_codon:yes stop_codon:yes gene_type:complete